MPHGTCIRNTNRTLSGNPYPQNQHQAHLRDHHRPSDNHHPPHHAQRPQTPRPRDHPLTTPRHHSPDEKGITLHEDQRTYKVTPTCTRCHTQYTTEWGTGNEPYQELRHLGWKKGKVTSGNLTWQRAQCPTYYTNCADAQSTQIHLYHNHTILTNLYQFDGPNA